MARPNNKNKLEGRGLSPNGATALGVADKLGSVETGKFADLVVVNGNPLEDIKTARNIRIVSDVSPFGTMVADATQCENGAHTPIDEPPTTRAGNVSGFSLHAGVAMKANKRHRLERLWRKLKDRVKKVTIGQCVKFMIAGSCRL